MKTIITKSVLLSTVLFFSHQINAQNIGINGTGANAHASALLDVDATGSLNKGLLVPRIPLTAINAAAPVTSPATSLLVYNTASASTGTNAVSPGYYYWDGTKWVRFAYTPSGSSSEAWTTLGNAGTTPTTNFLGTTDTQDLVFRTNNLEAVRITTAGNVGIGTSTPSTKLFVKQGTARITNNSWASLEIYNYNNANNAAYLGLLGAYGTEASPVYPNTGKPLGTIYGRDAVDGATSATNYGGSQIDFYASENFNATAKGSDMRFSTTLNGAVLPTERMRIMDNGNVGIGISSPIAQLDIVANTTVTSFPILRLQRSGATGPLYFSSGANGGDYNALVTAGDKSIIFDNDGNPLSDATTGLVIGPHVSVLNPSGGAKGLRILENGNIGIGISTPLAKTHITGVASTVYNSGLMIQSPNAFQELDILPGYALTNSTPSGIQENLTMTIRSSGSSAGNLALATGNEERLRITTVGNVGIGTTTPTLKLHLHDAAQNFHALRFSSGVSQANYWDIVKRGDAYGGGANHNFVFAYNGQEWFTITPTGNVGLNQAVPKSRLDVNGAKPGAGPGTGAANDAPSQVIIPDGSGGASYLNDWPISWGGGLATWDIVGSSTFFGSYVTRSDRRLKKDISEMNTTISSNFMKLRPVTYTLKKETPENNGTQYGFIAQEVAELFPSIVTKDSGIEGTTIGMNYQALIAPTIYVVQEQQKKIEAQQSQIAELLKRIEALEKK